MLEICHTVVYGLKRALRASGNPMTVGPIGVVQEDFEKALKRGSRLGRAPSGSGHDTFLKGIIVQFDIKYPQYWTPEAQRYHWLEIISSQSKMHRLLVMGQREDFATMFNKYVDSQIISIVKSYVDKYNSALNDEERYTYFMKALSNLPMGFEMWETLTTNYLQLKTIVKQRMHHKLKEDWGVFVAWALELPHFKDLTGLENETLINLNSSLV